MSPYWSGLAQQAEQFAMLFAIAIVMLLPFFIAERLWPVNERPSLREYGLNVLIALSTTAITAPVGVVAADLANALRPHLPWHTIEFTFSDIHTGIPALDPAAQIAAMILLPVLLHDMWFYWSHRIEHAVPVLWQFHRLHHSDPNMNASTASRDHILQMAWRAFFSLFTIGLVFDLDLKQAQTAAVYSGLFMALWSNFYHSAIRIRLPWLDPILVTPQLHRLHHSRDPAHYNCNFADFLPVFDIVFGTYRRTKRNEWPFTGLDDWTPGNLWVAQAGPIRNAFKLLVRVRKPHSAQQTDASVL